MYLHKKTIAAVVAANLIPILGMSSALANGVCFINNTPYKITLTNADNKTLTLPKRSGDTNQCFTDKMQHYQIMVYYMSQDVYNILPVQQGIFFNDNFITGKNKLWQVGDRKCQTMPTSNNRSIKDYICALNDGDSGGVWRLYFCSYENRNNCKQPYPGS